MSAMRNRIVVHPRLCNLGIIVAGVMGLTLQAGCEQRGACCFENNECLSNTTEQVCTGGGGMYRGNGSTCFPDACFVQIFGACCVADGTCSLQGKDNCTAISGTFQGENTVCEPNPCGGACCREEFCDISTEQDCDGDFRAGISCTPNPCVGGCCLEDGTCEMERTREQCEGVGSYLGDGTNCDPNMCSGACCDAEGQCVVVSESNCEGEYAGPATTCEPNPCMGACCDEAGECTVTTEDACDGTYEGGGTVCDATACVGACCVSEAACSLQTIFNCGAIQGTHQGLGTECEPNPCGGACCSERLCDVMKEEDCLGEFHAGQSCDPNICVGACCFPDETCLDEELEENCTASQGQYQGDGTSCMSNECMGACCKNSECTLLTDIECERIDGMYQGHTTSCDPNPCVQTVTGACCESLPGLSDSCDIVSEAECISIGGTFLGSESTCASGCPCESDSDCPEDEDLCTVAVCEAAVCDQASKCSSEEECNPQDGTCSTPTVSEVCCFGTECQDNPMGAQYCLDGYGTPISSATCADTPNPCAP